MYRRAMWNSFWGIFAGGILGMNRVWPNYRTARHSTPGARSVCMVGVGITIYAITPHHNHIVHQHRNCLWCICRSFTRGQCRHEYTDRIHQVFVSWLQGVTEKAKKGELPQPEVTPPEKGDIFVEGVGWTRIEILQYCLTLKPLEIEHNGDVFRLTLLAPKRPQELSGRWDARWDSNRWVAEIIGEDQKWRVVNLHALVRKTRHGPTGFPTRRCSEPEPAESRSNKSSARSGRLRSLTSRTFARLRRPQPKRKQPRQSIR